MPTANELLRDLAIRHAVLLERYKDHEVIHALQFLATEALPDLESKLRWRLDRIRMRGFDTGPWSTGRYRDMMLALRGAIADGMRLLQEKTIPRLGDFAQAEGEWTKKVLDHALVQVRLETKLPGVPTLRQIVKEPVYDQKLTDWFKGIERTTTDRVNRAVTRGLATGENTDQIVRRVMGRAGRDEAVAGMLRSDASMLVRTAVNSIGARAREITYEENPRIVTGVQWVSTLDARTSIICASLDGRVWDVGHGPRPPAHPNCRSTTTPVLASMAALGLKASEFPEGTRASMNGEVPESIAYPAWLRTQPVSVQNAMLGEGKGAIFRRGIVPFERYVRQPSLQPLSLRELLTLEQELLRAA